MSALLARDMMPRPGPRPKVQAKRPGARCEVYVSRPVDGAVLSRIVQRASQDLSLDLPVEIRPALPGESTSTVVLVMPAPMAGSQHRIWCLACQLACYSRDVRLTVQVTGVPFARS